MPIDQRVRSTYRLITNDSLWPSDHPHISADWPY